MKSLSILMFFIGLSAYADTNQIVLATVQSDVYPGEVYTVGVDLNEAGQQIGLYYLDPNQADPANRERHFSLNDLKTEPRVLVRVKDKYNMIKISYVNSVFTILFRRDAMRDENNPSNWRSKQLQIVGDENRKSYSLVDLDTGSSVREIFIHKHVNPIFRMIVGIDSIYTN